ncbi:MAG TPA: KTSC domain-containing protein [Candidatus Acidoferrum sp.]
MPNQTNREDRSPPFRTADEIELDEFYGVPVPLASEVIDEVRYDQYKQSLDVTFTSGKTYTFSGVPPDIFLGLVHASSPGRYFNEKLKGKYG